MCPCFCAPQPSLLIIPVTGLYMKLKDKGVWSWCKQKERIQPREKTRFTWTKKQTNQISSEASYHCSCIWCCSDAVNPPGWSQIFNSLLSAAQKYCKKSESRKMCVLCRRLSPKKSQRNPPPTPHTHAAPERSPDVVKLPLLLRPKLHCLGTVL